MKLDNGDRNLIVSGLGRLLAEPTDPLTNPPEIATQIRALRDRITFGDVQPVIFRDKGISESEIADEARDAKTIADAHAVVEAVIAAEDALESSTPQYALMYLRRRLESWLREQPDVADLDEVGDGIYGFRLANTNEISLTVGLTQ